MAMLFWTTTPSPPYPVTFEFIELIPSLRSKGPGGEYQNRGPLDISSHVLESGLGRSIVVLWGYFLYNILYGIFDRLISLSVWPRLAAGYPHNTWLLARAQFFFCRRRQDICWCISHHLEMKGQGLWAWSH